MEMQTEQEREIVVSVGQSVRRSWANLMIMPTLALVVLIFLLVRQWNWFISLPIFDPTRITPLLMMGTIGSLDAFLARRALRKSMVLVVNRHGFSIGEPHTVGRLLLPWPEIEAIYPANKHLASLFCLSIQLRDLQHFRASLNPLQRLSVRKKPGRTGAAINIQQLLLDTSLEELLSQITERFADELNCYQIRLSREA